MNKFLIVGNWKMNLNTAEAGMLVHRLHEKIKIHKDVEVVIAPSSLTLQPISLLTDHRKFKLAAQNAYFQDQGAYTGEISFTMLSGLVDYVLVGHSERRHIFNESLDDVTKKVAAAFRNKLVPIICVGETKTERLANETEQVLHDQVVTALANVTSEEVKNIVIAYEPVWAIGTGDVATADQAIFAANVIRKNIKELYGNEAAKEVRILYGGSINSSVAGDFLRAKGINGLLIGGASLNYAQFSDIVNIALRIKNGLKTKGDYK